MRKIVFLLMALMLSLSAGMMACGDDDGENAPPGPGPKTTAPTSAPTGMPTEFPTGFPEPGSVEPVHFSDLIGFMPDAPSGWDADDPFGQTSSGMEGYSFTIASRDYTNNSTDEYVEVAIYDSAYFYGFGWFAMYNEDYFFEWESTDGYAKKTSVDGYNAVEIYDKPDDYTRAVMVADRFMVMITTETKDALDLFSGLINYDGIADVI